jgi:uncharacterized protein (TIGR02246 family)
VPIARRALLMLTGAAALAALVPMPVHAQAGPSPSRRTPEAALAAWVEAFNSRDPKRIVALYAPAAVFWGTKAEAIATTPAQIWDYFKDSGQRPAVRVSIDSTHTRTFGDVAVLSGAYTFFDLRDGERSNVRPARYTIVLQKAGDAWQIVDHHSSRVPAPAP